MYRPHILFRVQMVVLGAMGLLTAVYLVVYLPLTRKAAERDLAMDGLQHQIRSLDLRYRMGLGTDLDTIRGNLRLTQKSLESLRASAEQIRERLSLAKEWRDRVRQPFQLIDFDLKRQQLIDELRQRAQGNGVELGPDAPNAYPEHHPGQDIYAQLWAELFVVDQILLTATANKIKTIKTATLLPIETHPSLDGGHNLLDEYSLRLELAGSAESLTGFLLSLPWLPDELKGLNLPVGSPAKPALFLKRLILKRDLASPNGAFLEAVVSGLVARDLPPP